MRLLKREHDGVVLIEAAFIFPLFFILMFGILEVYKMKVADRLAESVATNVAVDFSARGSISTSRIQTIITKCNQESSFKLISNEDINSKLRCSIDVFSDHDTAKVSPIPSTWPSKQGEVQYHGTESLNRGDTIAVTCFFKYEFMTALTRKVFMGASNDQADSEGNQNKSFLLIARRQFIKCTVDS